MLTLIRRTMAPVGPLTLSRWQTRANIGTDRPTKAFRTAPRPCWAKRSWQFAAPSATVLIGGGKISEPKKCARAACQCTALIAVIMAVTAINSELSDTTRRARTIITVSRASVKIKVILLIVKILFHGHYA